MGSLRPVFVLTLCLAMSAAACSGSGSSSSTTSSPTVASTTSTVAGSTTTSTVTSSPTTTTTTTAPDPGPPNIVLVNTDDQAAHLLAHMPAVQAEMVAAGVSFPNAFVTTPNCCPSRASLLTGRYARNTGVLDNSGALGGFLAFDDHDTVATRLQAAGYRTGLFGKYLNGYLPHGHYLGYVPPGWDEFLEGVGYFGWTATDNGVPAEYGWSDDDYSTDVLAERMLGFVADAAADGEPFFAYLAPFAPHGSANQGRSHPAPRHAGLAADLPPHRPPAHNEADMSDKPAHLVGDPLAEGAEFLITNKAPSYREVGRGWANVAVPGHAAATVRGSAARGVSASWTLDNAGPFPYRIFFYRAVSPEASSSVLLRVGGESQVLDLSEGSPGWVEFGVTALPRSGPSVTVTNLDAGSLMLVDAIRLERHSTVADLDRLRASDVESLLSVDEAVGRLFALLRETGVADNTVVIFTSDNGFLYGEHRQFGKRLLYPEATRVPLVVWDGRSPGAASRAELVANIDLAPTLLDLAEAAADEESDGRSMLPLLAGDDVPWRTELLLEVWSDVGDAVGVQTAEHLYIRHDTGAEELYDMVADPHQLQSLHAAPRSRTLLAGLRATLAELAGADPAVPVARSAALRPPRVAAASGLTVTFEVPSGVVAGAEVFVDVVGEPGTGVALSAVDGLFDEPTEEATIAVHTATSPTGGLSVAGLAGGEHMLLVRARTRSGTWGEPVSVPFVLRGTPQDAPLDVVEFLPPGRPSSYHRPGEGRWMPLDPRVRPLGTARGGLTMEVEIAAGASPGDELTVDLPSAGRGLRKDGSSLLVGSEVWASLAGGTGGAPLQVVWEAGPNLGLVTRVLRAVSFRADQVGAGPRTVRLRFVASDGTVGRPLVREIEVVAGP